MGVLLQVSVACLASNTPRQKDDKNPKVTKISNIASLLTLKKTFSFFCFVILHSQKQVMCQLSNFISNSNTPETKRRLIKVEAPKKMFFFDVFLRLGVYVFRIDMAGNLSFDMASTLRIISVEINPSS